MSKKEMQKVVNRVAGDYIKTINFCFFIDEVL